MKEWLPEEIRTLRKGLKLSQNGFSDLIGVSGNYVYLLERGVKRPSRTLRLLLDYVEEKSEKGKE